MGGAVLSPETFEWSDIVAMKVLMCLVHPRCRCLLPSTVFNTLVSVITWRTPAGARINHLSKAWECCSPLPSTASQDCRTFWLVPTSTV